MALNGQCKPCVTGEHAKCNGTEDNPCDCKSNGHGDY